MSSTSKEDMSDLSLSKKDLLMLPEEEIVIISLIASYCEYTSPDYAPIDTDEKAETFNASISEIEDKIAPYFPELNEDQLDGLFSNLFTLMNGRGLWDEPPEISPEHMGLLERGHQEYLRRKVETIKRLNDGNFLGKITCFLLGFEVINIYADILTKV